MANYSDIKKTLSEAAKLIDQDKVSEADKKIRTLVGKGLTSNDLTSNFTQNQMRKLRQWARPEKGA